MSFLAVLASKILEWFLSKVFFLIKRDVEQYETDKTNEKRNADEAKKLKDANDAKAIDEATHDSLNNI